ncbi:hypothetical protein FIBSPDRAFT_959967 [Athelia psychrophila]|uniref:Uncharacterized protein n=1 Tax=Athelia psychrophila TaxID=1759441 RepID=A0A166CYD5_9AGAM|nr:hypothetical protein FIBSPDRAFT_959967 [Fibularhizoctonia sp. CBS 109695]
MAPGYPRYLLGRTCNNHEVHWHVGLLCTYAAHGVEPLLPVDLAKATYLALRLDTQVPTAELLAIRARQLLKRDEDLAQVADRVFTARQRSTAQFIKEHRNSIRTFNFGPGDLVLVRNNSIKTSLDTKTLPRYTSPMVVVQRYPRGSYQLAEIDGAVLQLCYTAFQIIPYYSRTHISIPMDDFVLTPDLTADMMLSGDDEALDGMNDHDDGPQGSDSKSGPA